MSTISHAPTYPLATPPFAGSNPTTPYSNTFIPFLWSSRLIDKFYDTSILPTIANTNWEGEIKNKGDHVIIRQRPDVTVEAYEAEMDLAVTRPSATVVELLIDQGFYWNTALDDVMEVQADLNLLNMWAEDANEQMRVAIEREVLDYTAATSIAAASAGGTAGAAAGAISGNINLGVTVTTPITLTPSGTGPTAPTATTQDIMDFILRMAQVMDENNTPQEGRFIALPAWACQMLKASDIRMANEMGDQTSVYRNGVIGELDRMMVVKSNLLPNENSVQTTLAAGEHVIFAGTTHALTFANQITKTETIRSERSFSNLMRGLHVYGRQVVDQDRIVTAVVTH